MNADTFTDRVSLIAGQLADPQRVPGQGHRHSLADGATGISILYSTLATIDPQWAPTARTWLAYALAQPVKVDSGHGVFHGAPALAYALHIASSHDSDYLTHVHALQQPVSDIIEAKLTAAQQRLAAGQWCGYREYDVVSGLSGLAGLFLLTAPQSRLLRDVVSYLVTLTHPVEQGGQSLPGWWVHHAPNPTDTTASGGHGNLGIAHGITGPLAVLAMAWRQGITMPGHRAAIKAITDWLGAWQQGQPASPRWPPFVTGEHERDRTVDDLTPQPASWCYGSPGIAIALHHTAQALDCADLRTTAESAMLASLTTHTSPRLTQPGLCHGTAGLAVAARRIASHTPGATGHRLAGLAADIPHTASASDDVGLLTGSAGIALADSAGWPAVAWDRFLLLQ